MEVQFLGVGLRVNGLGGDFGLFMCRFGMCLLFLFHWRFEGDENEE